MIRFFLEFILRSALIAAGTGAVLRVLRVRSASARHAAWAAVMVQMFLLPQWISWGPKVSLRLLPIAAVQAESPAADTPLVDRKPSAGSHEVAPIAPGFTPVRSRGDWWTAFGVLYLLGAATLIGRLAIGTIRARRLIRTTFPVNGRLTSTRCMAPVTVGWLRPVVILPKEWREWPEDQLAAVLAHENAHARRRDPLVQWMALLNRAIFWFHPLAWYLERRLSGLAEEACDTAVLAQGLDPYEYSRCLLRMAETVIHSGARVEALGMAMPGSYLGHRIRRILENRPAPRLTRARMVSAMCACSLLTAIFAAGAIDRKPQVVPITVTTQTPSLTSQPSIASAPMSGPPKAPVAKPAASPVLVAQSRSAPTPAPQPQNQRLTALYFDLSEMTEADLARAVSTAEKLVQERLQDQDRIALMTHSRNSAFRVVEDFTNDRDKLVLALERLTLPPSGTGDVIASESRPAVIQRALEVLRALPVKKALVFLSSSTRNSGSPEELKSAIGDAISGNTAVYVIDVRGVPAK